MWILLSLIWIILIFSDPPLTTFKIAEAFLVPLALLAIGSAIYWIILKFKNDK